MCEGVYEEWGGIFLEYEVCQRLRKWDVSLVRRKNRHTSQNRRPWYIWVRHQSLFRWNEAARVEASFQTERSVHLSQWPNDFISEKGAREGPGKHQNKIKTIVVGPWQRWNCSLSLYFILQKDYNLSKLIQKYNERETWSGHRMQCL